MRRRRERMELNAVINVVNLIDVMLLLLVVFMMTAFASTDTAVEAMRLGAVDYFTKPFNIDELRLKVRQHLEARRLKEENVLLKRALNAGHEFSNMIGRSGVMVGTVDRIAERSVCRARKASRIAIVPTHIPS